MTAILSNSKARSLLLRLFSATVYLLVIHWVYVQFVNPQYEYAHYYYYERDAIMYVFGYLIALFPLFFYRVAGTPSDLGVSILYTTCYAPGQMLTLFIWSRSIDSLVILMLTWAASMCALFWSAGIRHIIYSSTVRNLKPVHDIKFNIDKNGRLFVYGLTLISLATTIYLNMDHMRFVGFADVYELRFQSADVVGGVAGYLSMWLPYLFLPYFIAVGLCEKKPWALIIGSLIALVVYTSNGSKSALLLPAIMLIYNKAILLKKDIINVLLRWLILLCGVLGILQDPFFYMAKAIVFVRTLSVAGWTMVAYHDYFSDYGFTYYTHINGIKQLTGNYKYGNYGLGQLIGMEYSGSLEANFNANFWASDGLAAMGVPGIIIITFFVSVTMIAINYVSTGFDKRFVSLLFVGFWIGLSNAPLSTSLLSCGGFILIYLLWVTKKKQGSQDT